MFYAHMLDTEYYDHWLQIDTVEEHRVTASYEFPINDMLTDLMTRRIMDNPEVLEILSITPIGYRRGV